MLYIKSVLLMLLGSGLIGVILQIWPGGEGREGEGRGGDALSAPLGSARLRSAPCLRPDWETNWMSNTVTCGAAGA